jgi:hypothetical protein
MPDMATLSSVDEILKDYYDDTDVQDMVMVKSPLIGLLPKATDFKGRQAPLPLMYSPTAGVSPDFAAAQASKADAEEVAFDITTNDMFSLFSLHHKAVQACKDDAGAFVELVTSRADAAMTAFRKVVAGAAYGNGGGALAQIESRTATTIVLEDRASMRVFDQNMQIQPATTDGTSGSVIADLETITAVNRQTRTLTAAAFDGTNYQATNYVFLRGGFGAYIKGLSAWLPTTAPGATSFFGVDRTADSRLYGVIRDVNTSIDTNLEEALISLSTDIADEGGEPDLVVMNTRALSQLVKQLGNKVQYDRMGAARADGSTAKFGFKTVKLIVETGEIDIVGDPFCPTNLVYMLQRNTWKWWSMGEMMGFLKYGDDDKKYARHNAENAMEGRIGGYFQLACKAPGWNGVMDIEDLLDEAA